MSIIEPETKDGFSSLCNLSAPPSVGFTPVLQLIDAEEIHWEETWSFCLAFSTVRQQALL